MIKNFKSLDNGYIDVNSYENASFDMIMACFCRSFDEGHLKKEKIHLISSIVYSDVVFSVSDFGERISRMDSVNIFYIFVVYENNSMMEYFKRRNSLQGVYSGRVVVYEITVDQVIDLFIYEKNNKYFLNFFGKINEKYKDFDSIGSNCLFLFVGLFWSTVVLLFKIKGIEISGGNSSKRHVLNTIDFQLINFLEDIYCNRQIIKKIIYNSLKVSYLSNSVPLDLYKKVLDINYEFSITQFQDIERIKMDLDPWSKLAYGHYLSKFIINNYYKSYKLLVDNYISIIKKEIVNLTLNIDELRNRLSDLKNKLEINDDLPKVQNNLKKSILDCENEIENLYSEKSKKKSDLDKFLENKTRISIVELMKLVDFSKLPPKQILNKGKFISVPQSYNKGQNRRYCSICFKNNISSLLFKPRFQLEENFIQNIKKIHTCVSRKMSVNNDSLNITMVNKLESLSLKKKDKISIEMSNYFKYIYKILENNNLSDIERQLEIEKSWFNKSSFYLGGEKLINKSPHLLINKLKKSEETLELYSAKGVLKKKFPNAYFYLNDFHLLMITYMIALNSVSRNMGYTATARFIGSRIIQYIYFNNIKKKNNKNQLEINSIKENLENYEDFVKFIKITSNEDFIRLGDFFLTILTQYPSDIFERGYNQFDSYINQVDIKLVFNKVLNTEILENIVVDPFALPMICPPVTWSDYNFGSFLFNNELKEGLVRGSSKHGHLMKNKETLYKAVNYLSGIKFRINTSVLDYLNNTDNEELLNELFKGKSSLQNLISLNIALLYKNRVIYLPVSSDWRGRMYTMPFYNTYQGSDFSLSLLEFWEGHTLTNEGLNSLYIYGANVYNYKGQSKDTFDSRIAWVYKNKDKILKMDNEFINGAENKLVFIAFCLTMRDLDKDPNCLIRIPVFLDATCNGLQHLAAIMRDKNLGSHVNLIKQNNFSKPNDLYTRLLKPINEEIRRIGREDPKYSMLANVDLKRFNVKKPIMTKPYNATIVGMKESLIETFKKVDEKKKGKEARYLISTLSKDNVVLSDLEIIKMAAVIYNIIYSEFPSLHFIYSYFIDMAKLLNKLNMTIIWFTPTGLEIVQKYHKSTQRKIGVSLSGKSKTMVLREWTNEIDKNKQVAAIIPNIIHSLDASHIMQIIMDLENKDYPIITVHDCFGTHPNNLQNLSDLVKMKFIKIYTQHDFLLEFHDWNIKLIEKNGYIIKEILDKNKNTIKVILTEKGKLKIPPIPSVGDLDLSDVLHSKHFIT